MKYRFLKLEKIFERTNNSTIFSLANHPRKCACNIETDCVVGRSTEVGYDSYNGFGCLGGLIVAFVALVTLVALLLTSVTLFCV